MRLFQMPVLIAIRNPFRFRNPYAKGLAVHLFNTPPTVAVYAAHVTCWRRTPSPWLSATPDTPVTAGVTTVSSFWPGDEKLIFRFASANPGPRGRGGGGRG